jgi:Na+-transporting NADH:ubiquinone oxidoreductase subunit C
MRRDSTLYTVGFTFVVCAVFVFFLALANEATKDRVAANRRIAERKAVLSALGVPAEPSAGPAAIDSAYERDVASVPSDAAAGNLFRVGSGAGARYAMKVSGAGLWGGISAILAVDARVERIVGLEIVSQNETPGLGGRIGEAWFTEQFRGEAVKGGAIRIRQGGGTGDADHDNGELDAVTGASLTSSAMERIVNAGLSAFAGIRDRGGLE